MGYCKNNNYDKNHEWDGGTLILDPGVFTFDEPHVYMDNDPPGYATGIDCLYRNDLQQRCESPAKLLATNHYQAPASVKAKCDTLSFDEGYCCPPYAMPSNWRVDYLSMGEDEEGTMPTSEEIAAEAELYAAEARVIAGKIQLEAQPTLDEFTVDAADVYASLSTEVNAAAMQVDTATRQAATQIAPAATEVKETMREKIRKHPLLALGLGVVAGAVVAKAFSGRR